MKKIFIKSTFIFSFVLTLLFSFCVNINAGNYTTNVDLVGDIQTSTLWDGVTLDRMHIKSKRVGATAPTDVVYDWDTVAITAEKNPAVRIVTWGIDSNMSGASYKAGTTMNIAKDYEKNHPGYTVIAGVNGDFFANRGFITSAGVNHASASNEPLNTWIADGEAFKSVVMANPDHIVLGFKEDRSYTYHLGSIYGSNFENIYSDRVYEGTGAVRGENIPTFSEHSFFTVKDQKVIANVYRQSKVLDPNGVNIFWKGVYDDVDVSEYTVWEVSVDRLSIPNDGFNKTFIGRHPSDSSLHAMDYNLDYTHYYLRGRLMQEVEIDTISNVADNRAYIVTKNQDILNEFELKEIIKVQYELTGDWKDVTSTMGVLFPFLINGKRTAYVSTKGAEYNNNYLNDNKPKPAIGFKEDGSCVFFFMGPGPLSKVASNGPSSIEMAEVMEEMGLVDAFCLDGGGSASIIARNKNGVLEELNTPTDGSTRPIANAILMVVENSNLALKDKTSDTATFYQKEPMVKSELVSATVHINNKEYPFNGTEVVVNGLEKDTTYEYYFSYTYENNGKQYSTKTNVSSFKTYSKTVLDQPSNFKVTLNENNKHKFNGSVTFDSNGTTVECVGVLISNVLFNLLDEPTLPIKDITTLKVKYSTDGEKFEIDVTDFELIINDYVEEDTNVETKPGNSCNFGSYLILPLIACLYVLLVKKER